MEIFSAESLVNTIFDGGIDSISQEGFLGDLGKRLLGRSPAIEAKIKKQNITIFDSATVYGQWKSLVVDFKMVMEYDEIFDDYIAIYEDLFKSMDDINGDSFSREYFLNEFRDFDFWLNSIEERIGKITCSGNIASTKYRTILTNSKMILSMNADMYGYFSKGFPKQLMIKPLDSIISQMKKTEKGPAVDGAVDKALELKTKVMKMSKICDSKYKEIASKIKDNMNGINSLISIVK
jgi:hypothetical protein